MRLVPALHSGRAIEDHNGMQPADRAPGTAAAPGAGDASARTANVLARGSLYTIATAVQLGSGLLAIPILTRVLDPIEFGTVTAALVSQAILVNVAAFGIPVAVQRTFFRAGDQGPRAARALIGATLIGALVVAAVAFLTGPIWSGVFDGVPWGGVLQLAVISAIPSAVLLSAQLALQAADRVRGFLLSAAIATAGAQCLGVALAAASGDPVGYLAGVTIGFMLAAAVAWIAAGVDLHHLRPSKGGRSLVRGALALGLPTIPHGLALYLLSAGDRVVVERLEGLAAAGAYYVAYAIGGLGIFLVAALNGAWQPIVFGVADGERWQLLARTAVETLRVVSIAIAAIAIGAPCALAVLAPSDYDVSGLGSVSALVALSTLPYFWVSLNSTVLIWSGRTSVFALATPVSVGFNLLLCALLIPPLGLEGAALATLAGYLLLAALTWFGSRSLASVPWDLRVLAIAALPALVAVAFALVIPDHDLWLLLRGLVAGGLSVLALTRLTAELRAGRAIPTAT